MLPIHCNWNGSLHIYNDNDPAVKENVSPGTFVAEVAAHDFDCGPSREVDCQLDSTPGEYNISTNATIDYEETTNYTLNVTCTDLGFQQHLSSDLEITVFVLDENDNPAVIMVNPFSEGGEITFFECQRYNSLSLRALIQYKDDILPI